MAGAVAAALDMVVEKMVADVVTADSMAAEAGVVKSIAV